MGFTRERVGAGGKVRYAATYRDLKGRQRSAGTFSSRRKADRAWQRAEGKVAQGYLGEPGRGRQTFRDYVEKTWLPNHEIEASTRQSYTYVLRHRILPEFGSMRMIDILPEHVREWVAGMKAGGVTPHTIRYAMVVLSAIFTTALNDQVTSLHPCKGVKTPPVPAQPRQIITPEQFAVLYGCLPDAQSKLLVETAVESGLRWGELTELRVRDLDFATRMLTVTRAVVQVDPKFHPEGSRFLVKPYPKDKEYRRFKLSMEITAKLRAHVVEHDLGWVAVRHAPDHIHIAATLARQDGGRAKTWNDFYQVREACQGAERQLGLRSTAPADRTAAKRPSRAETEQAARRGWSDAPRVSLRREVCAAAAGASTEREFFGRLEYAGVLVRKRHSTVSPGEVTGYAVGLPDHATKDGGTVWYGGGKLAADLTLPKLRARWAGPAEESLGQPLHGVMARGVLRNRVTAAAEHAQDETGFFAQLRETGVLVRLRFSEINPGEVTGYSVTLPEHTGPDGEPRWYGGGRLADGLTLPRLRRYWSQDRTAAAPHAGSFRFTAPEREAFYRHAAREAAAATEHIRRSAGSAPAAAADTAWAAAATFHATARAIRDPALRRAADTYDRAARMAHWTIPRRTSEGDGLRGAARFVAMVGRDTDGTMPAVVTLAANLVSLATAVAELRQAQEHAAQAAAARQAAEHLYASLSQTRAGAVALGIAVRPGQSRTIRRPGDAARLDFPMPLQPGQPLPADPSVTGSCASYSPTRSAPSRASPRR